MRLPKTPPAGDPVAILFTAPDAITRVIASGAYRATIDERYVHWDNLTHRVAPAGISLEEWWAAIKLARRASYKPLPLRDKKGRYFNLGSPDTLLRQVSEIDRDLSGRVKLPKELLNRDTRDRYLVSALIEEAITSSQLEGATTTGPVAREMIRSNRKPRDKHEQMIMNNFMAINFVREVKDQPLDRDLVCQIHRYITSETLDNPAGAGCLRDGDDIRVWDDTDLVVLHDPPLAIELPERMEAMCAFANGQGSDDYIHPIVRAALLHFWLAYDHPFEDGNGRTARALFYWSMLHADYDMCEFVSISHILRKAPAQYSRAYLHTETDENDTTYFVLYQLDILQKGIKALHEFVRQKVLSIDQMRQTLRKSSDYNHRQLALLSHAMTHPLSSYSVTSHSSSHNVTRQTARVDLQELVTRGFLNESKSGKQILYTPTRDLEQRLQDPQKA